MNKFKVRYIGLSKRKSGLKNIQKYINEFNDDGDDENSDGDDGDNEDEDDDEEPEEEVAHRQLEARSWLYEGRKEYNWFLSTLTDKHESTVRANEESKDIMNLIQQFLK